MNAVTEIKETAAVPATDGLMNALVSAASDPNVDVEKLERLGALYERITAAQAEQNFDDAMNAAQKEMRAIATDANNPQTKSRYASYAALDRALRPIYAAHGFSLSFFTGEGAPPDHVRVCCRVARAGHKETPYLDMPCDGKGARGGDVMTKTHAMGAAITYGKRYLLGMIFNIAVGDKDDDGNGNGGRDMGAAAQRAIEEINACDTLADLRKWKADKYAGVAAIVTSDEATAIVRLVNQRAAALKKADA